MEFSLLSDGPLFLQGFRDASLTVWDASSVLRNYEVRTGHVLSREELDTGYLATRLTDADYDLTTSVSVFTSLPTFSTPRNTPEGQKLAISCDSRFFNWITLTFRMYHGFLCALADALEYRPSN